LALQRSLTELLERKKGKKERNKHTDKKIITKGNGDRE
jgi:hypothetical protein